MHSAATSLTVPQMANLAVISVETQAVRMRDDGTDPTASVGFPLAASVPFTYDGDLARLKFIAQTGTAIVNVWYFLAT